MTVTSDGALVRRLIEDTQPVRATRMSVQRLRIHPKNDRDPGDLRELAANIREEGVHQALEVQRRGELLEVVDGKRRLLASRQAGLRTVPIVLVPVRSDDEVIAAMVSTAVHKRGLAEPELRRAVQSLMDTYGWPMARVCRHFGVTREVVEAWLAEEPAPGPVAKKTPRPPRRRKTVGARVLAETLDQLERETMRPEDIPRAFAQLRALLPPVDEQVGGGTR